MILLSVFVFYCTFPLFYISIIILLCLYSIVYFCNNIIVRMASSIDFGEEQPSRIYRERAENMKGDNNSVFVQSNNYQCS